MLAFLLLNAVITLTPRLNPVEDLSALDQAVQSRAVETLTNAGDDTLPSLIQLWHETDRFDVRKRIALILTRHGSAGTSAFLEICRHNAVFNNSGQRELIVRGLAALGPRSIEEVATAAEQSNAGAASVLGYLIAELQCDPAPYARRLLSNPVPEVRAKAIRLIQRLPIPERSELLVEVLKDANPSVRAEAAHDAVKWTQADREAAPDQFSAYVSELCGLVQSSDDAVVRCAVVTLLAHDAKCPDGLASLRAVFRDPAREFWLRVSAMKAYITLHEDQAVAVGEVVALVSAAPAAVCAALEDVDGKLIPDQAIAALASVMRHARNRETEWGESVLVNIGERAVPELIRTLSDGEEQSSGHAAEVLSQIGPPAVDALPALLDELKSRGHGWHGERYVRAIIAIDASSAPVREALTRLITEPGEPMRRYVAGAAIEQLIRTHGEQAWVQDLVKLVIDADEHPLRERVFHYPPRSIASVLDADQARLRTELLETSSRDEAWQFALGLGPEPTEPPALSQERDRRTRAATALRALERWEPATIDALLKAASSEIADLPAPPTYGEYPTGDQRAAMRRIVWELERYCIDTIASTLTAVMHRRPDVCASVVEKLGERPYALAAALSSPIFEGPTAHHLTLPDDPGIAALNALASQAVIVTPGSSRQAWALAALGRLPTTDPRRLQVLMNVIHFGAGEAGPPAAMVGLGFTHAITPEILQVIKEGLSDARVEMRSAAVTAAGNAGPDARELVDPLLAVGRRWLTYSIGSNVAQALPRIAPDDDRVRAFLAEYEASQAQRRRR